MSTKPVQQTPAARTISHSARSMGTYVLAGRGAGKSRMLARVIAWQDYIRGTPQVIIDPLGVGTIDNFLDKVLRFLQYVPKSQHYRFWQRIVYIDMAGKDGFITPLPLYYTLGSERSLREVAERYLQVILKSNPGLMNAQVQGWPPLHFIGVQTGMLLTALGEQITSAESLLRHPEQWLSRMALAEARDPEVTPATAFFKTEFIQMRDQDRQRLTNPFLDKVFQFSLDPSLKAMFGANVPGIDWREVQRKGQTVLLDFRHVLDPEVRRFLLLWVFSYLYEWIKLRGRSQQPFAVLIDEFAALTQKVFTGVNPLATELDEFINQYMRNHNIWLTIAHQSINQIDEQLRNTLLSLGTYVFGRAGTMEEARVLADALFKSNPMRVKHERVVWQPPSRFRRENLDAKPQTEPVFMPLTEQLELAAQRIHRLDLFSFLLRPALSEGQVSSEVYPITIRDVDRDKETGEYLYPDQHVLLRLRSILAAQSGIPIATLLREQEARLSPGAIQAQQTGAHTPGTAPALASPTLPTQRRHRVAHSTEGRTDAV